MDWKSELSRLEDDVCDLPRGVGVVICLHEHFTQHAGNEPDELMTFALDRLQDQARDLQARFQRVLAAALKELSQTAANGAASPASSPAA